MTRTMIYKANILFYPVIVVHSFPRNVLDDLQTLVAELKGDFYGRLFLLLPCKVSHNGADVLLATQTFRFLSTEEPNVVGRLLYVVFLL